MINMVRRAQKEVQVEQNELEIVKQDVLDMEATVKRKAEEQRKIDARIKELLTLTKSLYSPTI